MSFILLLGDSERQETPDMNEVEKPQEPIQPQTPQIKQHSKPKRPVNAKPSLPKSSSTTYLGELKQLY